MEPGFLHYGVRSFSFPQELIMFVCNRKSAGGHPAKQDVLYFMKCCDGIRVTYINILFVCTVPVPRASKA